MLRTSLFLALAVIATPLAGQDTAQITAEARAYLERALDKMEEGSVRREIVDWQVLRAAALEEARGAQSPRDTHAAIRFALRELGDGHSFLITMYDGLGDMADYAITKADSTVRRVSDSIGYVSVPGFEGQTPEVTTEFATDLHRRIADVDGPEIRGWVVDLRGCEGGNMWPMLAGLGPILGEGDVGAFVPPEGGGTKWGYRGGASVQNGRRNVAVEEPYRLRQPNSPVAVLTSKVTASSGEAVVVAFRGRPRTRSFGAPTAGVSTANDMIRLSDGTLMFLTVATYADRTGRLYGQEIVPDVPVELSEGEPADGEDPVLDAALRWLADELERGPGIGESHR